MAAILRPSVAAIFKKFNDSGGQIGPDLPGDPLRKRQKPKKKRERAHLKGTFTNFSENERGKRPAKRAQIYQIEK